jgi:chromosome segregation ATPase
LIEKWDEKPIALDPKDTKKNLESKSKSLQAKVKHARQQAGLEGKSRVEISDRLQKARADFRQAMETHKKLQQMYDNLVADIADRRKRWNRQLKENQKVVTRAFDMYLQKKGYAGAVRFNHDEKTLHLTCLVDNQDDTSRTEDVRQLSGGERSYATLCLLMALGHVVGRPTVCDS